MAIQFYPLKDNLSITVLVLTGPKVFEVLPVYSAYVSYTLAFADPTEC